MKRHSTACPSPQFPIAGPGFDPLTALGAVPTPNDNWAPLTPTESLSEKGRRDLRHGILGLKWYANCISFQHCTHSIIFILDADCRACRSRAGSGLDRVGRLAGHQCCQQRDLGIPTPRECGNPQPTAGRSACRTC